MSLDTLRLHSTTLRLHYDYIRLQVEWPLERVLFSPFFVIDNYGGEGVVMAHAFLVVHLCNVFNIVDYPTLHVGING